MKKLLFALALGASITAVQAQDSEFKPTAGSKNLEFQFAPLGGSPISISGLRFRSFSSPTSAIRANVFLGFMNTSTITRDASTGVKELKTKKSQFDINIRPGIENHFTGTDRLSPYVGAEVDIAFRSTKETQEDDGQNNDIVETEIKNKDGFLRLGLNAVAGFDYYFAKKVYVGAELGFGLGFTNPMTTKTKSEGTTVESKANKDKTINFGPNVNSAIRLGYLF